MSLLRRARCDHVLALAALLAPATAHAVCGDGVQQEDEQCDDGNAVANDACNNRCRLSCEKIYEGLTSHTCGHARFGPFVDVAAQSYPGFGFTDISASHTYFTLSLSGAPGANRSQVIYAPGTDFIYAFYLKENYPFAVFSSAGDEVPLVFEHEVPLCGPPDTSLTWVKTYELSSQEIYTLVVGPTGGTTASLAIELTGPSVPAFWDRDGDEYGGAMAGLAACTYEAATVETPGDCNDENATVYPGAPTPELCDGVDSDCSGDDDTGVEGLCSGDSAGAACVAAGAVIRCGCAADADCGGVATCNVTEQRCETSSGAADAGDAGAVDSGVDGADSSVGGGGSGAGGRGDAGGPVATGGAAGGSSGGGGSGTAAGGSSGGTTGGSSGAGKAGAAASGPDGGGEPAPAGGGAESDDGCGCRTVARGAPSAPLGVLAAFIVGLLRRRRSGIGSV